MRYHDNDEINREMTRYAFLSAYSARNDEEESEAYLLHQKYGERTGWPLNPRIGGELKMPLAPSYEFSILLKDEGAYIALWKKMSSDKKYFFVAGHKTIVPLTEHMRTLTESQCEQFLAVKAPKSKKVKS